ncbi:MFS transporter [Leucobacter massiliensis]|uniref:MFS transporter n=1 Tax=Leucobacter massiliensis TaxID=1686285 RepID=A0A2S9QLY2_9MICO|nr:MFS transporter [Leucobacter massiliensis]PRI10609.1 MFS transporter [Leucobacter massiliensis]
MCIRRQAVAVLTASLLVLMMDMTILNIALPEMAAELHPSSDQQLWIIDVYSLVLAGLLVSFAAIADRWGRKRMLMLGYTIFGGASLLVLFATNAEGVIAIRALLGVGGAMIMPITLSLIRVIFTDPRERAVALGVWAAVSGLGAAVGPLIGGVLLEHFSWHAAFLINVPLMVAGVIAGILILPESRVASPGRWDAFAALLSLVGMTLLVWAIKSFGKAATLLVPEALIAFAAGAALMAWFIVRCVRSDSPLLDLRLFRNREFSAGTVAALGSMFAMAAALLLIAQWMQLVDGASPVEAGIRLFPLAIASAVASLAAPALARLVGARAVLAGGVGVAGVGMLLIALQPGTLQTATVIVALALVGAGGGSLAIGSAMIMHGSPEEKAGNAGAIEETSYELGAVLGIAILGSISALIYRSELVASGVLAGLDGALGAQAESSLGAAVSIAGASGLPQLASEAGIAFTHALQATGIAGGIIMLAVAVLVFVLTPRGTLLTTEPADHMEW